MLHIFRPLLGSRLSLVSEYAPTLGLLGKSAQWTGRLLSIRGPVAHVRVAQKLSTATAATKTSRSVGYWMLLSAGSVFGIVVWGGLTRLTESGLSMTEWNLIRGMKLPSSPQEWEEQFQKYKNFPEYKVLNKGMDLEEFKRIFWYEWFHRMWGRAIGVLTIVPLIYFTYKGKMSLQTRRRGYLIAGLVCFQGLLGWYMVKSGLDPKLEHNGAVPRVSQYRLAAHLGTAFVAYSAMFWTALDVFASHKGFTRLTTFSRVLKGAHLVTAQIFLTAMSGALVAGLDAGLVYNEWPTMGHYLIPDDLFALSDSDLAPNGQVRPLWTNFFENPTMVQFQHRLLAYATFSSIVALYLYARRLPMSISARRALNCTLLMGIAQPTLGILTLLYYVPTHLAAAHQAGSLSLLTCSLWLLHRLRHVPK